MLKKMYIEWHKTNTGLTIKGFTISPNSILVHLERLKGVEILAKKSWWLTDDFESYFKYKNHLFVIETPFAEVEVVAKDENTPKEIIREVLDHVASYRRVGSYSFIRGMLRYFCLPSNPP